MNIDNFLGREFSSAHLLVAPIDSGKSIQETQFYFTLDILEGKLKKIHHRLI